MQLKSMLALIVIFFTNLQLSHAFTSDEFNGSSMATEYSQQFESQMEPFYEEQGGEYESPMVRARPGDPSDIVPVGDAIIPLLIISVVYIAYKKRKILAKI